MTTAPDGRSLLGDIVRLDRLVASDIDSLYAAIGNEQVYAGGFGGGVAGMPADANHMAEQWVESSAERVAYIVACDYAQEAAAVGPDGCVAVPTGRGLGITYDWDRLYADQVDSTIFRA